MPTIYANIVLKKKIRDPKMKKIHYSPNISQDVSNIRGKGLCHQDEMLLL